MLLTMQQVCEVLKISESKARRMIQTGELKTDPKANGHCQFNHADLVPLMSKQTRNTKSKMRMNNVSVEDIRKSIENLKDSDVVSIELEDTEVIKGNSAFDVQIIGVKRKKSGRTWLVNNIRMMPNNVSY